MKQTLSTPKKWLVLIATAGFILATLLILSLPYGQHEPRAQAQYGPVGTVVFVPAPTRAPVNFDGLPINPNPRFPAILQGSVILCTFDPPGGDRVPCYTEEQIRRFFNPVDTITAESIFLNVRNHPSLSGRIITYLDQGASRPVYGLSRFGDWVYIRLNDGRWGWVAERLTSRTNENALPIIFVESIR